MPKGYFFVEVEITDPAAYEAYRTRVPDIISAHGGRILVRGEDAQPLAHERRPPAPRAGTSAGCHPQHPVPEKHALDLGRMALLMVVRVGQAGKGRGRLEALPRTKSHPGMDSRAGPILPPAPRNWTHCPTPRRFVFRPEHTVIAECFVPAGSPETPDLGFM